VIINLSIIKHIVASTKPEQAVVKSVTRKETDVWLVGQLSSTLSDTKLPAKKEVPYHCFFHYKQHPACNEKKTAPVLATLCLIMLKFSITICNRPILSEQQYTVCEL